MQWALGIMMYQMLSGHLPFWDAQSDRSPFAVMSAILNAEVRRHLLLFICRSMRTHDHVPRPSHSGHCACALLAAMCYARYPVVCMAMPGDSKGYKGNLLMMHGCVVQVRFDGPLWAKVSEEGKDFLSKLLDRDYNSRLSAADALQHPWIAKFCGGDVCSADENIVQLPPITSEQFL